MMRKRATCWLTAVVLGVLMAVPAVRADNDGVDEAFHWPSDREARLAELDARLLRLQRERFNASVHQNLGELARLRPELKSVEKERRELLRLTGRAVD
jgi:hypothetical protein